LFQSFQSFKQFNPLVEQTQIRSENGLNLFERIEREISDSFISGAEPAYQGGVTVELASNLNCFHAAPGARQVRKLRQSLCPRALRY
jgi:hypothetical protein